MEKKKQHTGQSALFDSDQPQVVEKKQLKPERAYVFDLMDALSAPVLTFSVAWAEMIPKRILDLIPMARMIALMSKSETATEEECAVYMYTRALEAPMSSDWVDIYLHITCKILEIRLGENHWDVLKAPRELNEWLQSKLMGLRNHIYTKRREMLKSRMKAEPLEEKEKPNKTKSTPPAPLTEQASFDF